MFVVAMDRWPGVRADVVAGESSEILDALRNPLEGEPRVEKFYADATPIDDFYIDQPGLTAMRTLDQLRSSLEDP